MRARAIAICIFLSAGTLVGQTSIDRPFLSRSARYDSARLENAEKNFVVSLKFDNDGVVESSIAHVVHMRIALPLNDMSEIQQALDELTVNGHNPVIRYTAYLATLVFSDPQSFEPIMAMDYESSDAFFSAIATRVQKTLLTHGVTSQR
jgi:hypothetical protein